MSEVITKKTPYIISVILFICGALSITTSFVATLIFILSGVFLLPSVLAKVKRRKIHYFSIATLVIVAIAVWGIDNSTQKDREVAKQEEQAKKAKAAREQRAETPNKRYVEEKREIVTSTPSQNYAIEDPRNIYLYCIGSTTICYTTPAECNSNKVYYSGGTCMPVACGTGATIANTAKCQRKGF